MATAEALTPEVIEKTVAPLRAGDNLSLDEFLRRWEAEPTIRKAELIGGVVFMPSPLQWDHGQIDLKVATWLGVFSAATPGCDPAANATWLMFGDSPQPDTSLRILTECGGQSSIVGKYASGAPEFVAEVCGSSAAYDLHQKLELYQSAGVREYLAVLIYEQEVRWHQLVNGAYQRLPTPADGVYRSVLFPGLWLNAPALLAGDMARVLATLNEGLATPEHAAFVARLASRKA
jgi:Uma2 family endonuclease